VGNNLQKVDTVMALYTGPWIYGGKKHIILRTVMRVSENKTLFLYYLFP
jgi:hypothetical protein